MSSGSRRAGGHPADAIKRLLAEKPVGKGLAVAGMPMGSPGMEMDGMAPETYEVVLFGRRARQPLPTLRGTDGSDPPLFRQVTVDVPSLDHDRRITRCRWRCTSPPCPGLTVCRIGE
jgi:hypothetical protein